MPEWFQYGLAGLAVVVCVKESFAFGRWVFARRNGYKNGNGKNGADSVIVWRGEVREIVGEHFQQIVLPIMQQQTKILEAVQKANTEISETLVELRTIARFQAKQTA